MTSLLFYGSSGYRLSNQGLKKTNTEAPEMVALKFYKWYLKNIYGHDKLSQPQVKLSKDSVYQVVPEGQFERLRKTGFFSEVFYKNQSAVYNKCNVQLRLVNPQDVAKCGCSPATFVKNSDCDFLSYYTWTGGQGEDLNTAKIEKVKTAGSVSKVTIAVGEYGYAFSHPEVTLLKEGHKWKIARIDLYFQNAEN
jgi:hypothetical protein